MQKDESVFVDVNMIRIRRMSKANKLKSTIIALVSMNLHNAIPLDDKTLRMISESNLDSPFVILNIDIANEKRLHKIKCTYVRRRMLPDSKKLHDTGSHWLLLEKDAPPEATKNCNGKNCWKGQ